MSFEQERKTRAATALRAFLIVVVLFLLACAWASYHLLSDGDGLSPKPERQKRTE